MSQKIALLEKQWAQEDEAEHRRIEQGLCTLFGKVRLILPKRTLFEELETDKGRARFRALAAVVTDADFVWYKKIHPQHYEMARPA